MNEHQPLIERLEALVDQDNQPDWEDVVRRAEAPAQEGRTERSRRSYLVRRLVPVFVLAAAAFAFVLVAPWQHGPGPTVMERALAAIGDRPVLHVVLTQASARTYIDLVTGRERPQLETTEIWYDRERHLVHYKFTSGGHLAELLQTQKGYSTSDHSGSSSGDPYVDPALAGFFDRYRSALESGDARTTGEGKVDGHDVTWIELPSKRGTTERIAVDETSSLPIRIEDRSSVEETYVTEVTSIETLPAGSGDFSKPKKTKASQTSYRIGRNQITTITPSAAVEALPGALWAGESISTLQLSSVSRATLTSQTYLSERLSTTSIETGIELHYGNGWAAVLWSELFTNEEPSGRGVVIHEQKAGPDVFFWPYPAAPAGSMLSNGREGWLVKNGIYVFIDASDQDLLLAAARALKPIDATSSQATP
jgi:hypothetical protein